MCNSSWHIVLVCEKENLTAHCSSLSYFCRHLWSFLNVHTYAVYFTLLYLSSLQCPRPLSPPSCCSQRAAETRSEQPLPGAHYIGAVPETSSYHAGRIGSSLPWILCTIVSLKSTHGRSTLQVCQREEWVLFRMVLHLTMKEHLSHVYSDSIHLKQIIGQTIMYNGTTSGFEVKSWQYTTLWTEPCHCELGVACGVHRIS